MWCCKVSCMRQQLYIVYRQNIMSSLMPEEMAVRKQSEVYDDLSHFIQIFKKAITQIELTAINIQKGNQYSYLLEGAKQIANSINPIRQKYSHDIAPLPIDSITFHRFVCRLAEPINLSKIKYQNISNMHLISCFITCLKQIESVIRKYQQERQFGRIIQLVQIIILKFCINCEGSIKIGSQKSYQSTIGESMKKNWPKSKQKVQNQHQIESVSSERQEQKKAVQVKKQKIPIVSQTLQDIQRRYDSLKCIDIDFSFFKTNYFQAKNSDGNYYKDCIERNSMSLRAIATYHDDFQLFLRRKELRYYRKNKRFHNQSSKIKDISIHQIPKLHKQTDRKDTIKAIKNKVSQTFDQASLKQKIINQIKEKDQMFSTGFDQNKVAYKMNNVYLTLGKKNMKQPCKNNMSPTMLKKKILQTQSNNHSYTETAQNQKYSTLYLQHKLKNTSEEKLVQRLKTELQKAPPQDTRKTIEQKIIGFVSSPIKKTMKGKYLQINCVSESKDKTKNALLKEVHKMKGGQNSRLLMRLKQD